ncbi:hypothetical protein, partial [Plastoroseomonas hellenica]|uniref:hypothetical protein n=1 Tax=Plastoroseomonas hellenica TaxID=2687306 RepID=UPI001BA56C68
MHELGGAAPTRATAGGLDDGHRLFSPDLRARYVHLSRLLPQMGRVPMPKLPWMATLCVLLTAGAEAQPTAAPPPPATGLALRNAFHQGATLVGAAEGFIWTERYAADGTLRGRYRGQSYVGRWTNENGELCTQPDGGAKT